MDDEPTLLINEYGTKFWRNAKGQFHKLDGPAIEWTDGGREWFQNGIKHREDGPAFIYFNADKKWLINNVAYKTKEEYFDALSDEAKAKCLFSEDFLNG